MTARRIALVSLALVACSTPPRPADVGSPDAPTLDAIDAAPATDVTDAFDAAALPRCPGPFSPTSDAERVIRRRIGIPDDASCAVVLGQNSHMDIDWQHTFDDYYTTWVEHILSSARVLLDGDPAYRYSVCEMAFLSHHVQQHPEERDALRAAVARGALRIVGGGMTSPDTLLPTTEPLVRDYLRGSLFAESALGAQARVAWLPDSFGHSPTVPDLLSGLGMHAVAFARVDGLHDGIEAIWHQPTIVPGSTAALLTSMGSNDFVWVGAGGGEVLAHWLPTRLYCQGDNLDYTGAPAPGTFIGGAYVGDDGDYTNAQIAQYTRELRGMSRTPYLFVPVGCDFQPPKPDLLAAVRHWNATMYPSSGVFAVASTFEDYADLIETRRADLPRMPRDIAPYFTGYLGSRLAVKSATRTAGDTLVQAEVVATLAHAVANAPWPEDAFGAAWDLFARTDHHDYIAGTAVDNVVANEQLPQLAAMNQTATTLLTSALGALANAVPADPRAIASAIVLGTVGGVAPRASTVALTLAQGAASDLSASVPSQILASTRAADGSITAAQVLLVVPSVAPLSYTRVAFAATPATGPVTLVQTATSVTLADASTGLSATIDATSGLLTSLRANATETLAAPSLDVQAYLDQGGLYRIGSETRSCSFTSAGGVMGAVTLQVLERGPARARVRIQRGAAVTLVVGLTAGMRRLDVDVDAGAPAGQALTARIATGVTSGSARFAHAAGTVSRPPQYLYDPTFWPTVRGMDLARVDGSGVAMLPSVSTGVRYGLDGVIEMFVSRDAVHEVCDELGAEGHEIGRQPVSFALRPHDAAIDLVAEAYALLPAPAAQLTHTGGTASASASLLALSGSGYIVSAAKPANRGAGTIVRFERTGSGSVQLGAGVLVPAMVTRTDLLERDLGSASTTVPLDAALVTLRVQ